MKYILLLALLIAGQSNVSAELPMPTNPAEQVWMDAGKCFALLEGIRQTSSDEAEEYWAEAVKRASLAFVNASKSAEISLDASSPENFHNVMRDYLVKFDKIIPREDLDELGELYDKCTLQYF